ncbi:MAG: hypothetical protein E7555_03130 [Ruminococcaceae bacterium]|nr:hypothetical protein [Oscillospiraceae bacterium]
MENIKPVIELELYLVRHGQSRGNAGAFSESDAEKELNDPHLTDLGIMQAKKAGKYLSDVNFDICFASGLIRTVQTANEIMNFQNEKKRLNILPIITEVGVKEDFAGRTLDEMKEACETAEMAKGFENAERLVVYSTHAEEEALYERAAKAISYFRSHYKNGEKVLVAGHAAFNTIMMFHIMGFDKSPVFDIDIKNTGIIHVVFYKEGTNKFGDIVFESINDTKHFCIPDEDVLPTSVSKLIKDDPENIDESVRLLVDGMKEIHGTKAEKATDIKPEMVQKTDEIMHSITAEKWQKLRSLVTAVENTGTSLISDCTTNSAHLVNGKVCFGKSEKEYKGYPVFDLGKLYESLIASSEIDRKVSYETLGFCRETAERVWEKVILTYFEGEDEALIQRADDRARTVAYLNIFHRLVKAGNADKAVFDYYKDKLIEYVTRVGSLDFE